MAKFRKKPAVIDAVMWTGFNQSEVSDFAGSCAVFNGGTGLIIKTLEGQHIASVGDWIIKGVHGEYYPCKPDIFHKTYEHV